MLQRSLILVGLVSALTYGCTGGDGDSYGGGTTAEVGERAESMVTRTGGGLVELDSGAAAVMVPPGAMPTDAMVSVEVVDPSEMPGREKLASSVFEFGPDGTTFLSPVTLTMDIDRSAVPSGADIEISWLNDGIWEALSDSQVTGDTVSASTTHFSVFAVTFTVVNGQVKQTGGMCQGNSFTACGGDPTGVWRIADSCLTADIDVSEAGGADCEGLSVSTDIDYTGTITIDAGGTYTTDMDVGIDFSATYPKSCLGATDCGQLGPDAQDTGSACVVSMSETDTAQDSGTWSVDGTIMSLSSDGDGPSEAEYCVSGNRMELNIQEEDVQIIMVLTR